MSNRNKSTEQTFFRNSWLISRRTYFLSFHGTARSFTVSTGACHWAPTSLSLIQSTTLYITGVLISPEADQEGNKLMFLSELREFPSALCLARKKTSWLFTTPCCWNRARRLTCFRTFFLPGRAKDLSAPRYLYKLYFNIAILFALTPLKRPQPFWFSDQNFV